MTSTDLALAALLGLRLAFSSQAQAHTHIPTRGQTFPNLLQKNCCIWRHHNQHTPIDTVLLLSLGFTLVFLRPPSPVPHCLPHNCTADALASTGALFWKDHLGIFRFWNLRALVCDWLCWPHDNLGRNRSCELLPSVSLEGSWGGFGGLGDH